MSQTLRDKIDYLIEAYESERLFSLQNVNSGGQRDGNQNSIKWSRAVLRDLEQGRKYQFDEGTIKPSVYRPFSRRLLYFSRKLNEMIYQNDVIFPADMQNRFIGTAFGGRLEFCTFSGDCVPAYSIFSLDPTQNYPRYRYTKSGERIDNITDWGLNQFIKHYGKAANITKDAIFNYVYGVLHDPIYRETYAINLKRDFPRVPFYPDFHQWAAWGEALMALHIGYETVAPWPLERTDVEDVKAAAVGQSPKPFLKAIKDKGAIVLDSETTLAGIPPEAWTYKLGNRSGLEWVLDQHKEKTPKDKTIREKFNTYRFADYKEKVVDLLMRVARVSVETMAIVEAMKGAKR
jgi:predicted helicase